MIGNNKMTLNNGTMQEAVQFWLDSKTVTQMAKVGWITAVGTNGQFEVSLTSEESK